jgi:hypothetical protein
MGPTASFVVTACATEPINSNREDGDSGTLRNVGIYLQDYTVSRVPLIFCDKEVAKAGNSFGTSAVGSSYQATASQDRRL